MFKKKSDLDRALEELDKEAEDRAWAEKKAIYGDKFNAPKFYELSNPWNNVKSCIPLIIIIGFILWFTIPEFFEYLKKHEQMLKTYVENTDNVEKIKPF